MRKHNRLFWLGLALYGAGFFLFSIQMMGRGFSGWFCAKFTLTQPWESSGSLLRHQNLLEYSILISGLISPLFAITMALVFSQRWGQLFHILRIALLSMTPFCWIVFYYVKVYPREGYAVWLGGIVLALLSAKFGVVTNAQMVDA